MLRSSSQTIYCSRAAYLREDIDSILRLPVSLYRNGGIQYHYNPFKQGLDHGSTIHHTTPSLSKNNHRVLRSMQMESPSCICKSPNTLPSYTRDVAFPTHHGTRYPVAQRRYHKEQTDLVTSSHDSSPKNSSKHSLRQSGRSP